MKILFKNVGRDDRSWEAEFDCLDHKEMVKEVKRNSIVLSSNIEFFIDDQNRFGQIIVGGFRVIGTFEIVGAEATV
jgi:hypothetical protein